MLGWIIRILSGFKAGQKNVVNDRAENCAPPSRCPTAAGLSLQLRPPITGFQHFAPQLFSRLSPRIQPACGRIERAAYFETEVAAAK
jgi:hypothetical protein